jgi:hypothetical protein
MRCRPLIPTSAVAAAAVSLFTAGCGGGSSTIASSSAGGGNQATGLLPYAACMRSHGVSQFPDPASGGGIPKQSVVSALNEVTRSRAQAAQNDCRHLLPAGGSLSGQASHTVTAQQQQDYLDAAACMRSHGITDFPDPTFPGGNVNFDEPASIDTHSTQFTRAAQTCTRMIPAGLPYSRTGDP